MSSALDHLQLMARNNAYANERLLETCCQISKAELEAERSNFFPSIRETLNHILEVDRYYLDALTEAGRGRAVFEDEYLQTAGALKATQAEADSKLITFCDDLCEKDLTRKVAQDRGENETHFETIGNTLLHLFQHQIHHRGQVHAMLAETTASPPQLDEFFLKFDRHTTAQKYHECGNREENP